MVWALLLVTVLQRVPGTLARPALAALVAVAVGVSAYSAGSLGGRDTLDPTLGPDVSVLAARWIAADGPTGVYGSPDTGILGLALHGQVRVVNLDGLVNDHHYAELLAKRPPVLDRLRAAGVDFYVARLDTVLPYQRFDHLPPLPCARLVWESPAPAPFRGGFFPQKTTELPGHHLGRASLPLTGNL